MKKANAILLNVGDVEVVKLPITSPDSLSEISRLLNVEVHELELFSFNGYIAVWQEARKEPTSLEFTAKAGFRYPTFIDSRVVIMQYTFDEIDATDYLIDVDINHLKRHFNTKNRYWALTRMSVQYD